MRKPEQRVNPTKRIGAASSASASYVLLLLTTLGFFSLLTLAVATGAPVPALAIASFLVTVAIGTAYSNTDGASDSTVRFRIAVAALSLLPLAAGSLRLAPTILVAVAVAMIAARIRTKAPTEYVALGATIVGLYMGAAGNALLLSGLSLFGGFVLGAILRSRQQGKPQPLSPMSLLGLLAPVSALAVMDLARRAALTGVQLPAARWGLFALSLLVLAALASNRSLLLVAGRKALPFALVAVAVAVSTAPARGVVDELNQDSRAEQTLAAVAGSSGSTSMIGDEGAGPRAQFRGISFTDCDKYSIRDCLITYFDDIAAKRGVKAAIDDVVVKVRNNQGTTFPRHCHQVIHNLGQLSYQLTGGDFAAVASYDPQVCGTGFIHGLYEKYFDRYGDLLLTDTGSICQDMNLVQVWYAWTCNHILGHVIMTKLMANPAQASEYCLPLQGTQSFADCESGAWMNFWADDVIGAWFGQNAMNDPEKVFNVCYGAVQGAKFFCYQEIFPALTLISNNNLPLMAQWCRDYAEPSRGEGAIFTESGYDYADRCMQGVARAVAVTSGYDYRVATLRCVELEGIQADQCLSGAGASIVLNTGAVSAGIEMCERVKQSGYRQWCFLWAKQVGATLRSGPNSENMPKFGEVRIPDVTIREQLPPKVTEGLKN